MLEETPESIPEEVTDEPPHEIQNIKTACDTPGAGRIHLLRLRSPFGRTVCMGQFGTVFFIDGGAVLR